MTEQSKRRVALIGTGGTISSLGRDSLDVWEYMDAGRKIEPDDLLARYPETAQIAAIVPVPFRSVGLDLFDPPGFLCPSASVRSS
jgi:L-asparaginase/Glu-tRNA(Gln) amidotransferase subunit D